MVTTSHIHKIILVNVCEGVKKIVSAFLEKQNLQYLIKNLWIVQSKDDFGDQQLFSLSESIVLIVP